MHGPAGLIRHIVGSLLIRTFLASHFHMLLLNGYIMDFVLSGLQFAAQDFSYRGFWYFFDEDVAFRALEAREVRIGQAKLIELLGSKRGICRDNKCCHDMSPTLIRQACYGNFCNLWMSREYVFNFQRVNIFSTRNQHVIDSPLHPEISIIVPESEITCKVPALADGLLICIRSMPVAFEGLRRGEADDHLAGRVYAYDLVREDLAGWIGRHDTHILVETWSTSTGGLAIKPGANGEGINFRAAEVIDKDLRLEPLEAGLGERTGHGCPGVSETGEGC